MPPENFPQGNGVAAFAISLTVAQSKRLIAKGVAADPRVRRAMEKGMVAVCKGTTNGYVLEELLGQPVDKGKYVLGRTVPAGGTTAGQVFSGNIPEVIFRNGEPVAGLTLAQAVREMSAGDVVLKGANALDYGNRMAAVLIGHPEGGTMATVLGHVYGKGLELIVPVGLEKQVSRPLPELVREAHPALLGRFDIPRLWPLNGAVFTEIEALSALAGVQAIQIGAGGVCGAEGAVWLMIRGQAERVQVAKKLLESLQGEPSFEESVRGKS